MKQKWHLFDEITPRGNAIRPFGQSAQILPFIVPIVLYA
jgi:hypothetical protein